jgi:trypsin
VEVSGKQVIVFFSAMVVSIFVTASLAQAQIGTQVVGGNPVPDHKLRFVAAILVDPNGQPPSNRQFCTGSLIDRDSVLTAAHCVEAMRGEDVQVVVGRSDLRKTRQGDAVIGKQIFIHPRYEGEGNDIAIIELRRRVTAGRPIPIGDDSLEKPGTPVKVAGWGAIDPQGFIYPHRMQRATVDVVSDAKAKAQWAAQGLDYYPALHFAAIRDGKDTCFGDSGGPLWVNTEEGRFLLGATSWGSTPCARPAQGPGVYGELNAPSNLSFIEANS